jgi:hypothetical protein
MVFAVNTMDGGSNRDVTVPKGKEEEDEEGRRKKKEEEEEGTKGTLNRRG